MEPFSVSTSGAPQGGHGSIHRELPRECRPSAQRLADTDLDETPHSEVTGKDGREAERSDPLPIGERCGTSLQRQMYVGTEG